MYLCCIVNWTHFFSSKKEGATLSTHSSSKCPASARHWCVSWKAGVPHQLSVGRHWLAVHDECQRSVSGLNFQQLHICLSICCIQLPLLETEYTLYRLLTKIQKCVNWESTCSWRWTWERTAEKLHHVEESPSHCSLRSALSALFLLSRVVFLEELGAEVLPLFCHFLNCHTTQHGKLHL